MGDPEEQALLSSGMPVAVDQVLFFLQVHHMWYLLPPPLPIMSEGKVPATIPAVPVFR